MDHRRFDDLARLVGTETSRRRALGLLAGGLAGLLGRRAPASAGTCLPNGAICSDPGTCCEGFICLSTNPDAGVCSNGCRAEGANCRLDEECCNDLPCVTVSGEPFPICGGTVCSGLGESCATDNDCCFDLPCHENICKLTCGVDGESCAVVIECCEGFSCNQGGVCSAIGCLGAGESCVPWEEPFKRLLGSAGGDPITCCFGNCCGGVCCGAGEICGESGCEPEGCPLGEVEVTDGSCCRSADVCGSGETTLCCETGICCDGQCVAGDCCADADCDTGETCADNACGAACLVLGSLCDPEQTPNGGCCCGTACLSLNDDPPTCFSACRPENANCGALPGCDDCCEGLTCVANVCRTTFDGCPAGTVDIYGECCPEADVCGQIGAGGAGAAVCCTDGVCCDDECMADGDCCADGDCAPGKTCEDHVCTIGTGQLPSPSPKPTEPAATGGATTLPGTGSGSATTSGNDGLNALAAAGLVAGAAAIVVGRARRVAVVEPARRPDPTG